MDEQISQAEAQYRAQQAGLRNLNISSPVEGTIVRSYKNDGDTVTLGEPIFKIINKESLYFEILLDQEDFGSVTKSQMAEIELDAYPNVIFNGEIFEFPQIIENNQTVIPIKATISNPELLQILYGMTGESSIVVSETTNQVHALSFDEVFIDEKDLYYVWIVNNDNRLEKRYVNVGLEGDILTEIKDEIQNLTIVIPTASNQVLEEGQTVKIQK